MQSRALALAVASATLSLVLLSVHEARAVVATVTPLLVGASPFLTTPARALIWGYSDIRALATDGRTGTMIFLLFFLAIIGIFGALYHVRRHRQEKKTSELMAMINQEEKSPTLEPGEAYLITQGQARALKVFDEELKKGSRGLCISRTHPNKLKETMDLKSASLVWLSKEEEGGEGSLLQSLSVRISKFVYGKTKGIVLLDGLEYLVLQNDFPKVLKFLQRVKDMLAAKGAKLLLPVDLHALVESQRAMLTREFKQL